MYDMHCVVYMNKKMKDNEFKLFTDETSVVVITVVLLCLYGN